MLTLCYRYSEWVCVCCYLLECWLCLAQRQRGRDWQAQLYLLLVRAKLLREASGSGNDLLEGATSIHNLQSEWQLFLKDSMYEGRWTVILPFSPLWITGDGLRGDESRALWNWWMVKFVFVEHWETVMLSYQEWNAGSLLGTKEKYTSTPAANTHIVFDNLQISNSKIQFLNFILARKGDPMIQYCVLQCRQGSSTLLAFI